MVVAETTLKVVLIANRSSTAGGQDEAASARPAAPPAEAVSTMLQTKTRARRGLNRPGIVVSNKLVTFENCSQTRKKRKKECDIGRNEVRFGGSIEELEPFGGSIEERSIGIVYTRGRGSCCNKRFFSFAIIFERKMIDLLHFI